jgi:hypothetical protein
LRRMGITLLHSVVMLELLLGFVFWALLCAAADSR